jgi:predicted Zn-dependent peptidase
MLRFTVPSLALVAFASPALAQLSHEKYQLDNGLTVILHQDRSVPRATINLWYRVGARNEPVGRSGFAHLFEHLMFMGTTRVPGNDFDVLMETGGGSNNATTSLDRTNYFSSGPASLLPTLLWLDADRLEDMGLTMTQDKVDKQRDVVRNERRQMIENAPYGKAYEATYQLMYPSVHPYYNGVIGTHADLEAATVQDVKDFFATFYQPNNCSLVVAGDFDPATIKPLVEQLFGSLPSGNVAPQRATPPAKLDRVIRVTTLDKVQLPALMIAYHSPAQYAEGDAELDIAGTILADGNNSRLYQRLVVQEALASEVSAGQDSAALGSIFRIGVYALPDADLARIEAIVDEELAKLIASGPTSEELARAQAKYELQLVASLQSIEARADRLNQYEYSFGNPDSLQRDLNRYRNATTASVQAWTGAVLRGDARLIQRVLAEEPERTASGRDQRPADAPSPSFVAPEPQLATLANGTKLMVFSRPGLPLVSMDVVFTPAPGSALDEPANAGRSVLLADMLDEGAGDLTGQQFADALQMIGASFDAGPAKESFTASMTVLKRGADRGMELMALALGQPRLAQEDWSRVQQLHLENLKQSDQNPSQVAGKVASKLLFGDTNPYGSPTGGTLRTAGALTLDDIRAAKSSILNPANATIIVSGDITKDEALALATKHFGSLATINTAAAAASNFAVPKPASPGLRVFVVDRPAAVQTVLHLRTTSVTSADANRVPLELLNTILGGSFTSRLNQNLRENNGYTYGARSSFQLSPSLGQFTASTSVKAEQTGPALKEFMGELRRIASGDIADAEATKARETVRADLIGSFGTLAGVTGLAGQMIATRLPWDTVSKDLALATTIDASALNALAKSAINLDNAVLVLVGDQKLVLEQIQPLIDAKIIPAATIVNAEGESPSAAK